MEKRAALFTEKGVIPFGLEALVDRPAFIHDTSPPRKAEENGWKREELRTAKGKSPLSLLSLLSLFVPFPSVVRETACSLPPSLSIPRSRTYRCLLSYKSIRKPKLLSLPFRGKSNALCASFMENLVHRTVATRDPVWPSRVKAKRSAFFFKRLVQASRHPL